jgi:DNA topoisomerase-2
VRRAIPSIVDGLKPSQRKILYGAFKKQQWKEIRVDQFYNSVSELSAYHHNDESLALTIIMMAQHFVGSNNMNLLKLSGQFGSHRNVILCFYYS